MINTSSRRIKQTPFMSYIENAGVKNYTVYNRTYLATVFDSLKNDYIHLNNYVQLWDVSCQKQLEISGVNALKFIQKFTPRDLSDLDIGKCIYAPIVDKFGKILNDPVIYKLDQNKYRLSISDSDLFLLFNGFSLGMGFDINLSQPKNYTIAVQGPKSNELIKKVFSKEISDIKYFQIVDLLYKNKEVLVSKTGFSSCGGYEIYIPNTQLSQNLWEEIFSLGQEFNIRVGCPNLIDRIEGGLLSFGNDMTYNDTALESGLERFCDLNKNIDCLGADSLRNELKNGLKKIIRYIIIDSDDIGICNVPWGIYYNNEKIGYITSSAYSPSFNKNVSIGMVDYEYSNIKDDIKVVSPSGSYSGKLYSKPFKFFRKIKES